MQDVEHTEESDTVVSADVAEMEFQRFVEAMDLDVDESGMDDEDKRDFSSQKRLFLKEVQRGRLTVDEKGQPVFTPSDGEPLTFYEPEGAHLTEMDRAKEQQSVKKTLLLLGAMTKTGPKRFTKMKNRDFKVCTAILAFFLGG